MTLVSFNSLIFTLAFLEYAKEKKIKRGRQFSRFPPHHLTGLIELATPVQFTKSIQPATLPKNCDEIDPFALAYAAGNGMTEAKRLPKDQTLRHGFFMTMLRQECESKIGSRIPNTASLICADSIEDRHVGSGDSGNS